MLIEELNSHFAKPVLSAGVLRVLVACEESQAVTKEFRKLGHEAFSCDLLPCSGGHPEWHLQHDVTDLLKLKWDMIIAFPPCTHLATSGTRHFEKKRKDGRQKEAIEFFMLFEKLDCPMVAIENPVNIIGGEYIKIHFPELCEKYNFRKSDQRIQPYEYGHDAKKTTCLWLKGLPKLKPTKFVEPRIITLSNGKKFSADYMEDVKRSKAGESSIERSKTYTGIAEAMAVQWSSYACR
jgi:site-specific DNA-cytosine methylase